MSISNVISLLSGVALFLFGMSLMGDGLKRVAGNRMETLLYKLTGTRLKAILLGTGVTAVIQSSSATSVMAVGFVNSKMMSLRQAIGVILGAILGTSVTGWIVALSGVGGGSGWASLLSIATLTGVIAIAGIIVRMTAKRTTHKHVGDILLGFAVLMFGMSTMSDAVAPLKEVPAFIELLTTFSNPLLGALVGAIFTAVLQSASAAVGILQALAMTGSVTFASAFPLIMGIAVGAALPVLMASAGASVNGKRTALVYLLIDAFGAAIVGAIFYSANAIAGFPFMTSALDTFGIAALNTAFRLATVLLLAPLTGVLEKLTCAIVKDGPKEAEQSGPVFEERFIPYPALALDQCQTAIDKMAELTQESVLTALETLREYMTERSERVAALEDLTDKYEDALGTYILKVTKGELNTAQSQTFTKFLHAITDFERIADHALNISEIAGRMTEQGVSFSGAAQAELDVLQAALIEVLRMTTDAFLQNDVPAAERVDPLEEVIDELCERMKGRQVERMKAGESDMAQGVAFNDLLTNFERVSDHCSNVALAMIEVELGAFQPHAYQHDEETQRAERFSRACVEFRKKYDLPNSAPLE